MTHLARPLGTAAAALVATVALTGVPGTQSATALERSAPTGATKVIHDCAHAAYQPETIVGPCGSTGLELRVTGYDSWTQRRAEGRGVAFIEDCEPTCAAGEVHRHRVTFVLREAVRLGSGARRFTELRVRYTDGGEREVVTVALPSRPVPD